MAGYRTLGRLLSVGLAAGAVIGAVVGTFVVGASGYLPLGLVGGAGSGMVAGVVAQALAFVAVLGARRRTRALPLRATYVVLGAVPTATACGLTWWLASISDTGLARCLAITGVALVLAIAAVKVAAPWCLAPLTARADSTRR